MTLDELIAELLKVRDEYNLYDRPTQVVLRLPDKAGTCVTVETAFLGNQLEVQLSGSI